MRIELVPYDARWEDRYVVEKDHIRRALGDRVRLIAHVGSTSVPGLLAKPILDIVLAVDDSADEGAYTPSLEEVGYKLKLREPDWHEHRLFTRPDPAVNLHVFGHGNQEVENMIVFRDQLRRSSQDRESYARAKQDLAREDWPSTQDYADAKGEVVASILSRARP